MPPNQRLEPTAPSALQLSRKSLACLSNLLQHKMTVDSGIAALVSAIIAAIVAVVSLYVSIKTEQERIHLEARLNLVIGVEQEKGGITEIV